MNILPTLRQEWFLLVSGGTSAAFLVFGHRWLADLSHPAWFTLMFAWLFTVILLSAFAVVRHAESLATKLGEPGGTLILTLAVTGIEVMMISAVMLTGKGNPSLARDAMFAVVMIALNGMVGFSLLLGGLRYHEQTYNLQGANAFLAVIIPLAVLSLVLPNFTLSSPGPTLSARQSVFLIIMSLGLYAVFLAMQIFRHRNYFMAPISPEPAEAPYWKCSSDDHDRSVSQLLLLLIMYLLPVIILAGQIAVPITHAIHELHAPSALGGVLVSVLVLSPESMSAVRAAMGNQLQRSVNLLLGSVLASISLTIPAVLTIGFVMDQTIILGLDAVGMTLLLLTLGISLLTFASARTNVLLGAVHLLLFLAYVMLIFER
ncbi:calcium:proton antiporter [Nitrospira lenta]|uniref:Putative ionic transporter y4hA n=1 Tax=Nitrospira lenta TaxID=1436998 RepID=A0A330L7Y9_9BACT|nr:calcium:proton antiporter [Nitrospira lenta]SPP65981.1 putative ionic transporter y4hA [Nitrospira lenta]